MKRKKLQFLTVLLYLILIPTVQLTAVENRTIHYDTAKIQVKQPLDNIIEKYRQNRDFDYNQSTAKNPDTLLGRIWYWVLDKVLYLLFRSKAAPYLRLVLVTAFILFLLYVILRSKSSRLFFRNKKLDNDLQVDTMEEDIRKMDLDTMINKEIQKKQYRIAIRLLYLKLLKQLHQAELIDWKIFKTNYDYCNELNKSDYYSIFKKLSAMYEYIWYGDFPISETGFHIVHSNFKSLYQRIS